MMLRALFILLCLMGAASAHDRLANGEPVPAWIKRSCCGANDYHPLRPDQVHAKPDGWHVDGYGKVVPYGEEMPSQDGSYAGFWLDYGDGQQSRMYCFFTPPQGF